MASKYDSFWERHLSIISDLIAQSVSWGSSTVVDVSDLKEHGKRESWYGVVDVSGYNVGRGEMVHAGSLGRIVCRNGLLKPYPDVKIRFTITQELQLQAKCLTAKEQPIDHPVAGKNISQVDFSRPENDQPRNVETALQLSSILAALPMEAWNAIVAKEPEWQHMIGFLPRYGFSPFAVLMTATGLNDYKLKQRAETGFWPQIRQMLEKLPLPGSCQDLFYYLVPFYQQERLESQKVHRLKTFLDSRLAQKLWHGSAQAIASDYRAIWAELAQVMGQKPEDKTISFAMKCLGLSLIMAGETSFNATDLPIPVDRRIIFFSERIRLCAGSTPEFIRQIWKTVLDQMRQKQANLTMIHLDSLIWQIALKNSEEMVQYFARLQQEAVGRDMARLVLFGTGRPAPVPPVPAEPLQQKKAVSMITQPEDRIACFIPCCSRKAASGQIMQPAFKFTEQDLPNTWTWLASGRNQMNSSIEKTSPPTSALHLYAGALYQAFAPVKSQVIDLIRSGRLSLYILSAGYGIVDAFEPIQSYDAMLKGDIAVLWRKQHLAEIIADLLIKSKPTRVYGFFAGGTAWYPAASTYRYFFTEGVRTALKQGLTAYAGCFYRKDGLGVQAILGGIGRAFAGLMEAGLDAAYAADIEKKGLDINSIQVGYARIEA